MTESAARLERAGGGSRAFRPAEAALALVAFGVAAFAAVGAVGRGGALPRGVPTVAGALLFVALMGAYLAFSVGAVARALDALVRRRAGRALAGVGLLWGVVVLYAALSGLPVLPRALAFAAYVAAPAAVLVAGEPTLPRRFPFRELAAVALFWLPVEFGLLPPLPAPPPAGLELSRFVGLVDALFLFLVVRPLPDVGYTFVLRGRELALAVLAFAVYSVVALPVGFATGFITWHPRPGGVQTALTPLIVYLAVAVPEELLFRGLIQNLLARWCGPARALLVASIVFGFAHLPDPRYVLLAAVAGVAYGWVYQRTGRITASAVTHALVDAAWSILLHR